jgi:hypothetical protein
VNVVVTNPDGQSASLASGFTFKGPAPTLSGVSPGSGPIDGGTPVTLTGTNFASGATVTLGGVQATGVTVVSATQINAVTPAHAQGSVNVVVTDPDGQSATLSAGYTFVLQPTLRSISPNNGPVSGGTHVTLTGTDFVSGATVTFGGAAASSIVVVNATTITATTPRHRQGGVNVTVTDPNGRNATLASGFVYHRH